MLMKDSIIVLKRVNKDPSKGWKLLTENCHAGIMSTETNPKT